jgi:NAD(P)-dependent dehydrogenase (short-subunit alcohol dehydrogenase family)
MIPAMYDLLQGRVSITELREVRVEDLLHRETVSLEEHDLVGFLGGKVVMVTGAGGSIGAELARQVARFGPSRLVLVERSEPALYTVDRELREAWPSLSIAPVVGDVGDRERMLAVFRDEQPQVMAHAAAHKHVPLMETNAAEAVKNNVLGSQTLGEVAGECGVPAVGRDRHRVHGGSAGGEAVRGAAVLGGVDGAGFCRVALAGRGRIRRPPADPSGREPAEVPRDDWARHDRRGLGMTRPVILTSLGRAGRGRIRRGLAAG